MAGPIARLYATLGLDARPFTEGIDTAQKKTQSFASQFKQGAMAGLGIGAGLGVAGIAASAIGGLVDAFGEAQQAASDLNEQQAKLGEVFDVSAGEIEAWSETAAKSMGLSQRAALEATGGIGNFLQAMGTGEGDAAQMSMSLVQLSSDLASFNNVAGGAEEVLVAIQAGLAGQTEPLRRYGVDISDAAVQARLLADGVQKVGGAFTQAQKVEARYAIIMEKTAKAQGDFARTADSSANQERTLAALREDAMARLGIYADNLLKFGQQISMVFIEGLAGVVDILQGINDVLFPQEKAMREAEQATLDLAKARGLDTKAMKAFLEQQAFLTTTEGKATVQAEQLAEAQALVNAATESGKEVWTDAEIAAAVFIGTYKTFHTSMEQAAEATEVGSEAQKAANENIERFLGLSSEQVAALTEGERATGGWSRIWTAFGKATLGAGQQLIKTGKDAAEATRAFIAMTRAVDLGKGSFRSFWDQVRADQKRIRFFLRNPDQVENELRRVESAIRRAERQKAQLMSVAEDKRNIGAIEAQDRLIRFLYDKANEYRGVGTKWGNAMEGGMESAFDPRLVVDRITANVAGFNRQLAGLFGAGNVALAGGGASGGGGGVTVHAGNIYGGEAGLRQLSRELQRATRMAERDRG